jgi:hypothetical protein
MITFDNVPPDRITDGDITMAQLRCECYTFYVGHTVDVGQPALCTNPHDGHPSGHGQTSVEHVVRTHTVTVTYTVD